MRVLHVEDRVVVGPPGPGVQVQVDLLVDRGTGQRVPGGVGPDRVDEVLEAMESSSAYSSVPLEGGNNEDEDAPGDEDE